MAIPRYPRRRRRARRTVPVLGLLLVLLTVVFGEVVAGGAQGDLPFRGWIEMFRADFPVFAGWVDAHPVLVWIFAFLFASAGFVVSALFLYWHRLDFLAVKRLRQHVCSRGYEGVVFLLSPPDRADVVFEAPCRIVVAGVAVPSGLGLDEDIRRLDGTRWPWQQFLRGLRPHSRTLRVAYLVGSLGSSGSHRRLAEAEALVLSAFPAAQAISHPAPVDFENFDELCVAIRAGVEFLSRSVGLDESEVIVDVTGGPKTASIAGAVVTLDGSVAFQYVETNPPHDVIEYDLVIRSPISL